MPRTIHAGDTGLNHSSQMRYMSEVYDHLKKAYHWMTQPPVEALNSSDQYGTKR